MPKIIDAPRRRKSVRFAPCVAYIDTLHLWFPDWRPELRALQRCYEAHRVKVRRNRIKIRNRVRTTYTVRVKRLDRTLLRDLAAVQFADGLKRANITRCDVAVDWTAETDDYRRRLRRFLWRHLVLRHRRAGDMQWWRDSDAHAWQTFRKGQRPPAKNLMLYSDKPSKLTRLRCVHLELRIIGGQACQRAGLVRVKDLLDLNPAAHFARFCRLVTHQDSRGSFDRLSRPSSAREAARYSLVASLSSDISCPCKAHVSPHHPHHRHTPFVGGIGRCCISVGCKKSSRVA